MAPSARDHSVPDGNARDPRALDPPQNGTYIVLDVTGRPALPSRPTRWSAISSGSTIGGRYRWSHSDRSDHLITYGDRR